MTVIAPSLNGVVLYNSPTQGQVLFISNAATHRVYKATLVDGQVYVYAGSGTSGYTGDGGPALSAQLNEPSGLTVDGSGNLFITDTTQNVVRRVDTAGNITTVAGNGKSGSQPFSGDGGPATSAQLSQPVSVAVDASGNLFITDTLHSRIREVTTNGIINTVVGTGIAGYNGDGAANAVNLNTPVGLAIDAAGNLYFSELLNHIVREVSGGNVTTIAGTPQTTGYTGDGGPATSAQLNGPQGVGVDAGGAVYISDSQNLVIRRVGTESPRVITTIAGIHNASGYKGDGGPALNASLTDPTFMSVDRNTGTVYVVDFGNIAVRAVSALPAAVTFPATANGSTATLTLTLSNAGDQSLVVSNMAFPSGFSLTGGSCGSTPTIAPGQSCTATVQFAPVSGGPTSGTLSITSNSSGGTVNVALSEAGGLRFVPVNPCRVVDSRLSGGTFATNEQRDYDIRHSTSVGCTSQPVPDSADVRAYSLNITVVPKGQLLYVTAFPTGNPGGAPNVSNLNSYDGRIKANAAIVPVLTTDSARRVSIFARNPTDVVVDINGYYVPDTSALAYFPVPPCRAVDTRRTAASGDNGLGGPSIVGAAASRQFNMVASPCGLPSSAQAYSLNVTAIPRTNSLNYLTLYPTGQSQPFVSTLNAPTGTVVANAAVVPAGSSGSISAFATDTIDLIIDVNGYYDASQTNAPGLSLYSVTPCRAFDTRGPNLDNPATVFSVAAQDIAGSQCAPPRAAQSYLVNTTVIPQASLAYITNWAHGTTQPLQSTLNAYDKAISSNLAVVPTIDGTVSSFTTAQTGLILDLFGYFAP